MKSSPAGRESRVSVRLEGESQAVLEFAAVVGHDRIGSEVRTRLHGGDQVVGRAAGIVQSGTVCRAAVHRAERIAVGVGCEVRMVEDVECIHPELQAKALAELPGLLDRHIGTDELRALAEAGWLVAHAPNGVPDRSKRGWVVDVGSTRTGRAAGSGDEGTTVGSRRPWRTSIAGSVQRVQT